MKVVVVVTTDWSPHYETFLEIIDSHLAVGDSVEMISCQGEMLACESNPDHTWQRCQSCIQRRAYGEQLLSQNISHRKFEKIHTVWQKEAHKLQTSFSSVEELKQYSIGTFDIGWAVLSSAVSITRDSTFKPQDNPDLVERLVISSWTVYQSFQQYLDDHTPDVVYIFNGRFASTRPILRLCQERGIQCMMHERAYANLDRYEITANTLPHDLEYQRKAVRQTWESSILHEQEKVAIARKFFEMRRYGGDPWKITSLQTTRQLPSTFDHSKKNVVIFQSSEDEFVALGDEWRNPIYINQFEGIKKILSEKEIVSDPNLRFFIRIHPYLRYSTEHEWSNFLSLNSETVTVIPPTDTVDSYALMESADIILTFGSTMGIEATFWEKPSILAGLAVYGELGSTIDVRTHADVIENILSPIQQINPIGAWMYGFYCESFGIPFKHFRVDGLNGGTYKGHVLYHKFWLRPLNKFLNALNGTTLGYWGRDAFQKYTLKKLHG